MSEENFFDWDNDTWSVLNSYFDEVSLVENKITSFNDLIDNIIPELIKKNSPISIPCNYDSQISAYKTKYLVHIKNFYINLPLIRENTDVIKPLFPNEARLRNLTYNSQIYVDLEIEKGELNVNSPIGDYKIVDHISESKCPLFKIPIMLRSKYCHLYLKPDDVRREMGECIMDEGGYYIVNGGEKVIIGQERISENRLYVWPQVKTNAKTYTHEVEIKSSTDQRFNPVKTNKMYILRETQSTRATKNIPKAIRVKIPSISPDKDIPLFILFKALGCVNDKEAYKYILSSIPDKDHYKFHKMLLYSAAETKKYGIYTSIQALRYIQSISLKINNYLKDLPSDVKHSVLNSEYVRDNIFSANVDSKKMKDSNDNYIKMTEEDFELKYIKDMLVREIFPHVGVDMVKKMIFLGYMCRRLLESYFGLRPPDNRDHYSNKRIDLDGQLLSQIVRNSYINLCRDIMKNVGHLIEIQSNDIHNKGVLLNEIKSNVKKIIGKSRIQEKITYALSTGSWSILKNVADSQKKGVAQVLNRNSFAGTLSHTRRIQSPLVQSTNKIVPPRRLDMTHYGMCCVDETPEGHQIGIVKNLALQCSIPTYSNEIMIVEILHRLRNSNNKKSVLPINEIMINQPNLMKESVIIFINGNPYGIVLEKDCKEVYDNLRIFKRCGIVYNKISIAWFIEWKEIHIQTDGGRFMRPLYIVKDNELLIKKEEAQHKWHELLDGTFRKYVNDERTLYNGGVIEYVDSNELETLMVAVNSDKLKEQNEDNDVYIKFTHCEINPMMIKGVISQMIPFSNSNPSPRNCYQSSMGKQALSIYTLNYNSRLDTIGHVLCYGQMPCVQTRTMIGTKLFKVPSGINPILGYISFSGYDQEDATVLNKASVERGLFCSLYFRTTTDERHKNKSSNSVEKYTNPYLVNMKKTQGINENSTHYNCIDIDGYPIESKEVSEEDAIIGKVISITDTNDDPKRKKYEFKNISIIAKHNESGIIDRTLCKNSNRALSNITLTNNDGYEIVKVRIAQLRFPEIGDKFASRHAQKGCTGLQLDQSDMPFMKNGMPLDFIMNPHGLPSRMTYAKMLETLLGKVCIATGKIQDGTPFKELDVNYYYDLLHKYGFSEFGDEVYNGFTGEKFTNKIFVGPTYYQRLKHMVIDKIHGRERGPKQLLTRQPAEGRSRDGGLRLGEMERDAFIGHGTSQMITESYMDRSDKFSIFIRKSDGVRIIGNKLKNIYSYNGEDVPKEDVREVLLPYATKLGFDEFMSSGFDVTYELDEFK